MYEVDQYTVALLHFEEGIKDECGNVWGAYNGASTFNTEPLFEGNCLSLNGQRQCIQANATFDFGTDDLTIDFLLVVKSLEGTSNTPYHGICSSMSASDHKGFCFGVYSDNSTFVTTSEDNSMPVSLNTLYHVAIVRHCGKWSVAVNGKFIPWTSDQQNKFFENYTKLSYITLGRSYTDLDNHYSNVCIKEFRISKGIARWTADFDPKAPTNLAANAGDSQVTLSWTAVAGANSYNVKRSTTAGGPYNTIASNVNGTNYVDTSVTNGTTYYYVVMAVSTDGESNNFNEASATPKATVIPPAAPINLTATAGDTQVTLSWTAVVNATSYNIKRSITAGGPYNTIASNVTGTNYVDKSVANGTTYYYVVTAVKANSESENSNEASATPEGHRLLVITMSDSSEREYKLTDTEVNKFIQWINGTGRNGDNGYKFDVVIDETIEYLIFDKIISFKVIPLAQ